MVVALFVLVGLALLAAGLIPDYRFPVRRRDGHSVPRHLRKAS